MVYVRYIIVNTVHKSDHNDDKVAPNVCGYLKLCYDIKRRFVVVLDGPPGVKHGAFQLAHEEELGRKARCSIEKIWMCAINIVLTSQEFVTVLQKLLVVELFKKFLPLTEVEGLLYNCSRITSTKCPLFCMTTFSASLTNLTVLLPQSRDYSCYVSTPILTPTPL
jgi:hypothetical protein